MFRDILLPLSSMSMLPEILDMILQEEKSCEVNGVLNHSENIAPKQPEAEKTVETLQQHLSDTLHLATAGFRYFLLTFQLITPKNLNKKDERKPEDSIAQDEESTGEYLNPLQPNFVSRKRNRKAIQSKETHPRPAHLQRKRSRKFQPPYQTLNICHQPISGRNQATSYYTFRKSSGQS